MHQVPTQNLCKKPTVPVQFLVCGYVHNAAQYCMKKLVLSDKSCRSTTFELFSGTRRSESPAPDGPQGPQEDSVIKQTLDLFLQVADQRFREVTKKALFD